jgi:hypothetical protein
VVHGLGQAENRIPGRRLFCRWRTRQGEGLTGAAALWLKEGDAGGHGVLVAGGPALHVLAAALLGCRRREGRRHFVVACKQEVVLQRRRSKSRRVAHRK